MTTMQITPSAFEQVNENDEQSLSFTTRMYRSNEKMIASICSIDLDFSSQDLNDMTTSNYSTRQTPYLFYTFILGFCLIVQK